MWDGWNQQQQETSTATYRNRNEQQDKTVAASTGVGYFLEEDLKDSDGSALEAEYSRLFVARFKHHDSLSKYRWTEEYATQTPYS